ncbi:hypothetical protein DPMN_013448 [Dreissena polymorpha]|uniref:Uncharacterized protein n=1 Tax=Dreissena polymorpha TaxID=45954 RepID=A0A9D4S1V3_DREPO|nr:hypothetical protein DPMN_013448 [Dreissena polymorpha]
MAPLAVTGRRLHPRDSFPSALSVLSTAVPGSLFKATPSKFQACFITSPGGFWSALYFLHTGGLAVPLSPSIYRRDLWQVRVSELSTTSPLHLGEDSNPSSAEDVRLEGDGLSWISRATRRSSPQAKSSAGDSCLGHDAHAPAADRVLYRIPHRYRLYRLEHITRRAKYWCTAT